MYALGTVLLLALGIAAVVALVRYVLRTPRAVDIAIGLVAAFGITWAADYSMFASWGVAFRQAWMGPVGTGLAIGGLAVAWDEILRLVASFTRHVADEAREIEARFPRAA